MNDRQFTAIITREDKAFVAHCAELGVTSQGHSVEDARANLKEAIELFLETASSAEIEEKLHDEVYVTSFATDWPRTQESRRSRRSRRE